MHEAQEEAVEASPEPPTLPFDTNVHYLIPVLDGQPEQASPLQGFAQSLCRSPRLVRMASLLPSDVLDLSHASNSFLSRRICGIDPINWHGQSPPTLMSMPVPRVMPFVVVIVGREDDPKTYTDWAASSEIPPLIVAVSGGDITFDDLSVDTLKLRFLQNCKLLRKWFASEDVDLVESAIESWKEPKRVPLDYSPEHHGSIEPNLGVLHTSGFEITLSGAFSKPGSDTAPYVKQIVETTRAVLNVRERIPVAGLEEAFPRNPGINLYAAGIYPEMLSRSIATEAPPKERKRLGSVIDILRRQTGYGFALSTDAQKEAIFGADFFAGKDQEKGPRPHPLFLIRQRELALGTEIVSSLAMSDLSATIRLPNDVNRSDGAVRQFAQQYRSNERRSGKRLQGFREVQKRLAQAVPKELVALLDETPDDIRIIANSHLEWLDIRGIPLGLRRNTSRIPVTPGNLFISQTVAQPILRLMPKHFNEVLVLSALKDDDPIRKMFDIAFDEFSKEWGDAIKVRKVSVKNEGDLINALNSFDGPLVIFDGHGSHRAKEPAKLHLQDVECDVWQLQKKVRCPPIVFLSSCDTHAADRNHATTASGFLSLGARAVIASVFPLNAVVAATFAARLVYRIAKYIPAAVNTFDRALNWTEIVSGMMRMQLLTDFLMLLLAKKLIDKDAYFELHSRSNMSINGYSGDPFGELIAKLVERGIERKVVEHELQVAIANSSAISYLNVGRPETIILDTEERFAKDVQRMHERKATELV
jgi:hypothetical protein